MSSAILLTVLKMLLQVEPTAPGFSVYPGDTLIPGAHNTVTVTACTNYNPDKLTFTTPTKGGQLPYSFQWQFGLSVTGPWTAITGATDVIYDPPNLINAGTYWYNCRITDNSGKMVMTTPKMIIIVPDPTVAVAGGGVISQNSAATITATVTDGTGIITYQWFVSLTGISLWTAISGATGSSIRIPASTVGIFYYRVKADASGAACSKPYSAVVPVIVVPDISPPTFSAPAGPFTFCVGNITAANYWSPGSGADPYRPDFFLFRKGDRFFDPDPANFIDDCDITFGFSIRWEISTKGSVFISGAGQPSDHENFAIPGSANGAVVNDITWWISDCTGTESLPVTRHIIIKSRTHIIDN